MYFWHLLHIFRCDHIHTCPCNIFHKHIPDVHRGSNLNIFQCFDTVKYFSFRNIFFCLYRNHCFTSAGDPYCRGNDSGWICHFLPRIDITALTGIPCNTDNFTVLHFTVSGQPIGQPIQIKFFSSIDIPPFYSCSIFTVIVFRSGYCKSCSFVSLISSISPGATTGRFL